MSDTLSRLRDLLAASPTMSRTEIAQKLGISRKTLYKHLERLRRTENAIIPPGKVGAPLGNANADGNQNAVVSAEYSTLWDAGLSDREQVAMRDAWRLPALDQVHRQLGLIDVRIGRMLERMQQTRAILAAGDSEGAAMMADSESHTDGRVGDMVMDTTTRRTIHARQVLERQEAAIDRVLQRRERLLGLKLKIEAAARGGGIRLVVDVL